MEQLHILLTPDKDHKKVFPNGQVIAFRNGKSLKDFLVRATLPKINGSMWEKNLFSFLLYKFCHDLYNRSLPENF